MLECRMSWREREEAAVVRTLQWGSEMESWKGELRTQKGEVLGITSSAVD